MYAIRSYYEHAPKNAVYDITVLPDQYVEILEQLPDGAAVLIQKPMGNDYKQAKEIVEVCERKNLVAVIPSYSIHYTKFYDLMHHYMMCIALGSNIFKSKTELAPRQIMTDAIKTYKELLDLTPSFCLEMNPIKIYEHMTQTDDIVV